MTADLPTHPSTEAVGEVRRPPVALDPPTPTLAERAQERRREVGETWHDPATYTHTSAGAPWVVDRDGPLARSLRTDGWLDPAAAKALIEELTETRGALAAEEEDRRDTYDEFEKLRSDLSAMTLERDQAVAHDRQPYPTADAYERVCVSQRRYRDLADRATGLLVKLADHGAKVGGVEAGKLRSEFLEQVVTQPDTRSLAEQLDKAQQQLTAMTSDRDWLREELGKAAAEIAELRALVANFVDPDECEYDHHRYCQTHGLHGEPCPHGRAKALAATKED